MVLSLPWLIPSANRSLRRAQLAHGGPDSCTLKKMIDNFFGLALFLGPENKMLLILNTK